MDGIISLKKTQIKALQQIRKESLDIYSRLHSIAEDSSFVNQIHEAYPDLPILPNLRCGAWYTDPAVANSTPAYFKSTDGHFSQWSFNLRRANLHVLPLVIEYSGVILVDSTREGKRIPDALSKTVPIWCAVINRAMSLLHPEKSASANWDTNLYTPPGAVSAQEHRQIELRLDEWAEALRDSSFDLPNLPLPLRPLWITPSTTTFPLLPRKEPLDFLPVICVSASQKIHGIERRTAGFVYIQGSGDDHELWGMGLTPEIYWKHKSRLLSAERTDLPELVSSLVNADSKADRAKILATPISKVSGRLLISSFADISIPSPYTASLSPAETIPTAATYILITPGATINVDASISTILRMTLPEGKKGSADFLKVVLPASTSFIHKQLSSGRRVCIACESGGDTSVGVALAALGLFFDDNGLFILDSLSTALDKKSIRTRLEWIIASRFQANPSRNTLKRVNEFLLSPSAYRASSGPDLKPDATA